MTNIDNIYEHLVGLDQTERVKFIVEAAPLASPLIGGDDCIGNMDEKTIENRIMQEQHETPLDRCLTVVCFDPEHQERSIPLNISTPRDIVIMAAFLGETIPTMVLYPPSVTRQKLVPGTINVPVFTVDYVIHPVPKDSHIDSVALAMNTLRTMFEGNCCHELLLKAVRSQRNVIKGEFNRTTLKEAVAIVERANAHPHSVLLDSEAFQIIRDDLDENGTIYGLETVVFNPTRRGLGDRSYVVPRQFGLGVLFRSNEHISCKQDLSGNLSVHLTTSIAAVVMNRSALASIED